MKILHVVPTYLPAYRYGGPIHSVHALNKYLVRAGSEVDVYTTAIDGPDDLKVPLDAPVELDGVRVHYFQPGRPRAWFYSPDMSRALRRDAGGFDIIHITSVFLAASYLGARSARGAGVPYVISPRGSLMRAPLARKSSFKKRAYLALVERRNLAGAAAIHFTTDIERQEYEATGLPLRRALVIPNGLDLESLPPGDPQALRRKLGIAADRKVVLHLGRLSWKKGFDTLVPAFARLAQDVPEAVLLLVGGDDEGYLPELRRLISAGGVQDKVILAGSLEAEERSAAYQAAAVFALPSYAENFAVSAAEAMYFGVPVVLSPEVGLAPQVRQAGAGVVVKKDADAVAAELKRILRDDRMAREMGEKGRALAETMSYEKVAGLFLKAYEDMSAVHFTRKFIKKYRKALETLKNR